MKYYIVLSFFLFTLNACNNNSKPATTNTVVNSAKEELPIKDFIKKFKVVPFPFYYLGWANNEYYRSHCFKLNKNSADTMFFKLEEEYPVYGYGLLADTSKFYSLIYFETGDDIYPVLVTYSKTGQQLSRENLLVHGCGSDCGLKYCSYTAQIDKNFKIYIADTLEYDGLCDSAGNYLPDSDSTFIYSKYGLVDKTGVIKLDGEKRQEYKNKP